MSTPTLHLGDLEIDTATTERRPADDLTQRQTIQFQFALGGTPVELNPSDDIASIARSEWRFLLLERLVDLRQSLAQPKVTSSSGLRRWYRSSYRALAESIAREAISFDATRGSDSNLGSRAGGLGSWVEASRCVFVLGDRVDGPQHVVCHVSVLRTREHDGVDHNVLLRTFLRLSDMQSPCAVFDAESGLITYGRPSRRIAGRRYWDVVIAPPVAVSDCDSGVEGLAKQDVDVYEVDGGNTCSVGDGRSTLVGGEDVSMEAGEAGPRFLTGSLEHVHDRARADIEFVHAAIEKAGQADHRLDEEFVEEVALARLAMANTRHVYSPGGGPTLDSSKRIVRGIIKAHELISRDR